MRKFLVIVISAVSFVSVAQMAFAQIPVYEPNPEIQGDVTAMVTTTQITNSIAGSNSVAEVHMGSVIDGNLTAAGLQQLTVDATTVKNSVSSGDSSEASITYGSVGETP